MARIRTVKPELFSHELLYEAEKHYGLPLRIAFIGLFTVCDREGRFKWRPRELKLGILPYDDVDFSLILNALLTLDFIRAYEVDGALYGYIPTWNKHQVINNRERQSELPEPRSPYIRSIPFTCGSRVFDASFTQLLPAQGEGKGREEEGKDIRKVSSETSLHSSMHDEAFATTQKSKLGTHESIPLQQNDLVVEVFEYWKLVMKHPRAKLDLPRKRKIQSALNLEYSVEQLKVAIDGCANTPFNMGQNEPKKRYDGLELILRNAEFIDRFIGNAPINNKTNSKDTVSQIDQLAEGAI